MVSFVVLQDAFVLCRIFRKSGSGPKNGEKYGAPFIEEEWEDEDESVVVPKQEDCTQELPVDEDSYLDANDIEQVCNFYEEHFNSVCLYHMITLYMTLQYFYPSSNICFICFQILNTDMPVEDVPLPLNFNQDDYSNIISNSDESNKSFDPPVQTVFHEHVEEQSNPMNFDIDYLLDQPYFDATSDFPLDETLFFEANDLKDDVNTDSGLDILDEYMSFYNSDLDNFQPTFDSLQNDNIALDSSSVLKGTHQEQNNDKDIASSSKKEHADQETGKRVFM